MNNTTKTGWIIASAIIVMFMLPTIGMSSSILNNLNSSSGSTVINYLPESGTVSNGMVSDCVKQLCTKYTTETSTNGHTNVIQYFYVYYNSTYNLLFYVLDSKVNAYNGANINSNNAAGAPSTICSSISCPSYMAIGNWFGHRIYMPTPYGHLQYSSPNEKVQSGQCGQVTLSASVSAGASACGVSVSGTVGVSYTYDLYDFCVDQLHGSFTNDQWVFESHEAGQTYARFVTATAVDYKPGYQQRISYCSIGHTTYVKSSPGWFWTTNYCLVGSSLAEISLYQTPVLN